MMGGRPRQFDAIEAGNWCQRIVKEEDAFMKGPPAHRDSAEAGGGMSSRRKRHRRRSRASGDRDDVLITPRGIESASRSRRSGNSERGSVVSSSQSLPCLALDACSTASSASEARSARIPGDLKSVSRFDLTKMDMMKIRPQLYDDGLVPTLRFKPERVYAPWVPGCQSYINYKPEFSLQPPR
eukprot:TRINITY_DN21051_c0_g1_i1.p2 TRINITY_DN21051_c0_g1~~TRINITY_DN21051_c0_g1_i1.p2  ORF type:complete len:183 (+),score=17.30 TRINITY_DN21051_c0_g1_i1:173-721(+)